MDLRGLRTRWAAQADLPPISAETMVGADARAQALGFPQDRLMEHAGTAVAAAVRALAVDLERWGTGPIVILCGPGNNGGDGYVAARRLALAGAHVIVAVVATDTHPTGAAGKNWDRIARDTGIAKVHLPVPRDVAIFGKDIAKAAVVVDALLGTGVQGALRQPIRAAVELIAIARTDGVPIVAVDTPTALDLSSGEPSDPVRPRGPDGHLPSSQDRPHHPPGSGVRRQGPGRADRDPRGSRSWLTRQEPVTWSAVASPAGARS